jgi:hypothetical protein
MHAMPVKQLTRDATGARDDSAVATSPGSEAVGAQIIVMPSQMIHFDALQGRRVCCSAGNREGL